MSKKFINTSFFGKSHSYEFKVPFKGRFVAYMDIGLSVAIGLSQNRVVGESPKKLHGNIDDFHNNFIRQNKVRELRIYYYHSLDSVLDFKLIIAEWKKETPQKISYQEIEKGTEELELYRVKGKRERKAPMGAYIPYSENGFKNISKIVSKTKNLIGKLKKLIDTPNELTEAIDLDYQLFSCCIDDEMHSTLITKNFLSNEGVNK